MARDKKLTAWHVDEKPAWPGDEKLVACPGGKSRLRGLGMWCRRSLGQGAGCVDWGPGQGTFICLWANLGTAQSAGTEGNILKSLRAHTGTVARSRMHCADGMPIIDFIFYY